MRYLPHTEEDTQEMLEVIGVSSLDELFRRVPASCRRQRPMDLPPALTEWQLKQHMMELAGRTSPAVNKGIFLGAGSYDHYIPEVVPYLLQRSEFVTSYTPYQPEISQGTLQAIYEYQTFMTRLLGMEVSNASLYDGATALAEAVLMAIRFTKKSKVLISNLIHPHYRQVLNTYVKPAGYELIELSRGEDGSTDHSMIPEAEDVAAVVVQSPNFFGCIEDLTAFAEIAREREALFICCFTEPLAYGLLKDPGSQGADVACGEGQSFGIPKSYGGPGLGIFTTKMKYVRNMPGRLVGKTADLEGKRGFVLTLATREQHIRREKATSNICTNNNLCALAATIYLAALGGTGLLKLAQLNYDKCEYLKQAMARTGVELPFRAPTFNEFVAKVDGLSEKYDQLLAKGIVAGLDLSAYYPDLEGHYLFSVTETKSKEDMDKLVEEIS
ncbi:MAG: aminomethyl-transferring glycine dehydrogenase subunit GcvPA [Deltaproteobacteria bacterium]|nr:aminomethyl-transferring glycine dehydrogenase subunit GcvPA [Deltaproteobacteria bacterium]MBW2082679.1 aminomethyl-transferring glycine dehydrogenase subunit GcvPA [Deltaproteobacteria bacterium]